MSLLTAAAWSVTIGGNAYPRAIVQQVTRELLPGVPVAQVRIPVGKRAAGGALVTEFPSVSPRQAVTLTCGAVTWSGDVVRVREVGDQGGVSLAVECQGLAARLARCYPVKFPWESGTVRAVPLFNTFANRGTAVGTAYQASSTDTGNSWTQGDAIASLVTWANTLDDGPAITIGDLSPLSQIDTWDVRGLTLLEAINRILGERQQYGLALRGNVLSAVALTPGSGATVDLTGPEIQRYEITQDGSATVHQVVAEGAEHVTVVSLDTAGGGGLVADWTGDQLTAQLAGVDLNAQASNPALRRYRVDPAFALADGTAAQGASWYGNVPIERDSGRVNFGYSSSVAVFGRRAQAETVTNADGSTTTWAAGTWADLSAQVSVSTASNLSLWIAGPLLTVLAGGTSKVPKYDRLKITAAIQSGTPLRQSRTDGAGYGTLRRDVGMRRIHLVSGTVYAVSDAGTPVTLGETIRQDGDLSSVLGYVAALSVADRILGSWTRTGLFTDLDVGDAIQAYTLPGGRTQAGLGVIRAVRYQADPIPATSYEVAPPEVLS